MSTSAVILANSVLKKSFCDGGPRISTMKLQRIVFFIAAEHAKANNDPLLSEHFQAWAYGPALASLHDHFSVFKGEDITSYGKNAKNESLMVDEAYNPELAKIINSVWSATKNADAVMLSRLTHQPGSAWSVTKAEGENFISLKSMKNDYTYYPLLGLRR